MHVSKDDFNDDDNIVLSYVYQVSDVNPRGMFWTFTNGRFWIVDKKVFNNSQGNVVTLSIATSMANIAMEGILMKEEPTMVSHDSKFSILIVESLFINFCDSFNKDNPSFLHVLVPIFVNSQIDKEWDFWMEAPLVNL
jgi:hypothetical protein